MNPTVDKTLIALPTAIRRHKNHPRRAPVMVAAMLAFSLLRFGRWGADAGSLGVLLTAVITYFLTMYLYFGIAQIAYQRQTFRLWGGAAAAIVLAFFLTGASDVWLVVTSWSVLLFGGVLSGRLTLSGHAAGRVYIIGAMAVVILFALQSLSMWSEFFTSAPQLVETFTQESEKFFLGLGYSPAMLQESLDQSRKLLELMVRLFPAATTLGALTQFTVGYLAFTVWLHRHEWAREGSISFTAWKTPFGITPLLIIAILIRLLGGETLKIVADNVLTVLAVYYSVTGLALMEYYLRRFRLSRFMKVFFYLLLFFTQFIGFLVAALLGFVDSFVDWRQRSGREVT